MNTKVLYTLPQSVGIVSGRPSSLYYFVRFLVNNLFSLDLQHTRATILLNRQKVSVSAGSGLGKRIRELELSGCQWWQIGTVGQGQRCRLGFNPGALCDVVRCRRASDVPLRLRVQNAALGARSERAHRVSLQD